MTTKWMAALLITAMSAPSWGQQSQPKGRFALTADQVARTLSGRGLQVADQQVSLLANVVATEPNPLLDVLTVEPLGPRGPDKRPVAHSLVRLACHESDKCLPFYAIVTWPAGPVEGASSAFGTSVDTVQPMWKPNVAIMMRAGTHATLLMDDERSHIQVAVISLENGIVGHRIRVTTPDHKQVFIGEVVSASLLRRSY
jgi:hypothetical protein